MWLEAGHHVGSCSYRSLIPSFDEVRIDNLDRVSNNVYEPACVTLIQCDQTRGKIWVRFEIQATCVQRFLHSLVSHPMIPFLIDGKAVPDAVSVEAVFEGMLDMPRITEESLSPVAMYSSRTRDSRNTS